MITELVSVQINLMSNKTLIQWRYKKNSTIIMQALLEWRIPSKKHFQDHYNATTNIVKQWRKSKEESHLLG